MWRKDQSLDEKLTKGDMFVFRTEGLAVAVVVGKVKVVVGVHCLLNYICDFG